MKTWRLLMLFAMALLQGCATPPVLELPSNSSSRFMDVEWEDLHGLPPQIAEQTSRTIIQKVVEDNLFTIDRGFKEYEDYFGSQFVRDLKRLKPGDHWIDGGAGNAYAQKDFLGSRNGHHIRPRRPKMTAITLKYPENQPKILGGGHFQVLSDRHFEDIPQDEIERADLITDVVGIINYTSQLDLVLERYLNLLKPHGKIYVFIPSDITLIRRGHSQLHLTEWLKSIPGLLIQSVDNKRSPYPSNYSFTIEKAACGITIPRLKLTAAVHRVAVIREFTEEGSAPSTE